MKKEKKNLFDTLLNSSSLNIVLDCYIEARENKHCDVTPTELADIAADALCEILFNDGKIS